ncbi:hypothetical protein HD806DRAFT_487701 [Xylariaceae sp. AK1471]|nr:hypothetical protein HD806DRAFT_487701 [Xylariaceae sp. AK1471]
MTEIRCPLPPDLATLKDYCDEWARWAARLEEIEAQYTGQAKLSAIQDDIDTIKAEIRQVNQRLQQRIQDRNAAIKEGWELYRARLARHLRELPLTDIPHLLPRGTGFGGEDGGGRNKAPPSTSSDGTGGPIRSQVPRGDRKSATLDSLAASALLHYDTEAAGSNPNKPAPYSFFEESSRASEADCATTICSSPSGSRFNHGAPHSSPVTLNGIKQENQQSPGGLAAYSSLLRAYGQTPQSFNQPKPADRQISPAERSSPTIPFSAGIPRTPASECNPDDQDVW